MRLYWSRAPMFLAIAIPLLGPVSSVREASSPDARPRRGQKVRVSALRSPHDEEVYDKRARVPLGMRLVEKGKRKWPFNAAISVDGVQSSTIPWPYEVFGQGSYALHRSETEDDHHVGVESVTTRRTASRRPRPDVLLIPGGDVEATYNNPRVIEWIRAKTEIAKYVMSVCNGAFILAKAGLLDGLGATTFYGLLDEFETFAPKVRVVRDQRFVDNGKIITSAGLSSGIDAAIHLIGKIHGSGRGTKGRSAHGVRLASGPRFRARGSRCGTAARLREPPGAAIRVLITQGYGTLETRWALTTELSASQTAL